jgi:hypothetical protein
MLSPLVRAESAPTISEKSTIVEGRSKYQSLKLGFEKALRFAHVEYQCQRDKYDDNGS